MLPDQRRKRAEVSGRELPLPVRLRQHLLEHERVDIDHAVLQRMQRQHAHLVILTVVAHEFTAAGEEDEVIGAIPSDVPL